MMKLYKLTAYLICIALTFPPVSKASNDMEEQYILMQEEEMRAKQMRADEIGDHITAIKQQVEDERQRIKHSNEEIWEKFIIEQEVKRKTLEDQLAVIGERQRRFESELEKKRYQDEVRLKKREVELDRLILEMQRLQAEVVQDRKELDLRMEAYNKRRQEALKDIGKYAPKSQASEAGEAAVLEKDGVKLSGFDPPNVMGTRPFHLRNTKAEYYIEIGDVLEIEVWRVTDLTKTVTVRPDGRISMPLVGDLDVEGMALTTLRDVITEKLTDYVISPQVSISLQAFGGRKFIALGEVGSPGVYRYEQQIYLIEAIALAGGFPEDAKKADVMIIRGDVRKQPKVKIIHANLNNVLKKGILTENIAIQPNDIIYVGKGIIGDANEVLRDIITPTFSTITDFFVARSAIRTAQQKGP